MVFYLLAAIIVPLSGLYGLAVFLAVSTIAYHSIELPWYFGHLAAYHCEFLAGVLAFIARPKLVRFGILASICNRLRYPFNLRRRMGSRLMGWPPIRGGSAIFLDPRLCKHPRHAIALANIYQPYRGCFIFDLFDSSARVPDRVCDCSKAPFPVWSEEPIRVACFVLILFLSFTSWEYFERPVIGFGNRLVARRVEKDAGSSNRRSKLRTETPPAMTFHK